MRDPGYFDPVARLAAMDRDGVQAEVLYSEVSAFRAYGLVQGDWRPISRAFTDLVEEFAAVDPDRLKFWCAGYLVFDGPGGGPVGFDRAAAREAMTAPEVVFALDLGIGVGRGEAFGCDLTEAYVVENSEYTT